MICWALPPGRLQSGVEEPRERAKPRGLSGVYGASFGDADVVRVYHLRPPYPDETIAQLARLASGGAVLDAGYEAGELARRLAPHVARVDTVDVSVRPARGALSRRASDGRRRWRR